MYAPLNTIMILEKKKMKTFSGRFFFLYMIAKISKMTYLRNTILYTIYKMY